MDETKRESDGYDYKCWSDLCEKGTVYTMEEYMERPRGVKLIYCTPLTGIGCLHYFEEKDCTARFATGAIWEFPD